MKINDKIWEAISENSQDNVKKYHDRNGVMLMVNQIGFDKDLHDKLGDETLVRKHYRDTFAEQGIGIVECNIVEILGNKSVKTIGKKIEQFEPAIYVGSLAIPLTDQSFVFSLISQEVGITGIRDTFILSKLISQGQQELEPDPETGEPTIPGWAQDPYFQDYEGPCLCNLSDSGVYDSDFPDHPLSKVRKRTDELVIDLAALNKTLVTKKSWWKIW